MSEYVTYHKQNNHKNIKKIRELLKDMPSFCRDYFRSIERQTSTKTQVAYVHDLIIFFQFLKEKNPIFKDIETKNIPLEYLEELRTLDIEEYIQYLKLYSKDGRNLSNTNPGIDRKISSLKSFFNFLNKTDMINHNPTTLLQLSKKTEKEIVYLDPDEVVMLLDEVEYGENLKQSSNARLAHERYKLRDLALITLLLGTGIRISECVGLDINDIDFKNCGILIHRKGGKEVTVFFGEEVEDSLQNYMNERIVLSPRPGYEAAFFLSSQRKRLSVSSVERIIKKYASVTSPLKKITPHKLRSTYGTSLYRETGDIYLVADVLGHSDVNVTKKHYSAIEKDRRRGARNAVRLREPSKPE